MKLPENLGKSLLNYYTPTRFLYALQTLTCCVFLVFALPLHLVVLVLQPPQSGTHSHLTFTTLPLPILSVTFLKLTASSRTSAPPSGSPMCLRFDHWLTLCTLNIHLLTYLLTKIAWHFPDSLWHSSPYCGYHVVHNNSIIMKYNSNNSVKYTKKTLSVYNTV